MNESLPTQRPASPKSWLILPLLALLILGIDQGSKALVVRHIPPFHAINPLPALSHLFNLTFITNTGAAFGFFQDRSIFFVVVAAVISLGIIWYLRQLPHDEWLLKVSLAMQLGGALGNLIDRVRLGYVVDFVDFRAWPVFNFADTFIVVGVGLLAYCLLLRPPKHERPPADSTSSPPQD